MGRIYKNWFVHNMFAHPLSEIVYWLSRPLGKSKSTALAKTIHDATIPEESNDG
tara:strand:+ start:426 stop:587 length:162 start_codon:yes stop_codon:yes gene_type:complete